MMTRNLTKNKNKSRKMRLVAENYEDYIREEDPDLEMEDEAPEYEEEIEVEIEDYLDTLRNKVKNEITLKKEISRTPIWFRKRGEKEILEGIPMAQFPKYPDLFVFKINGVLKTININNIVEEDEPLD